MRSPAASPCRLIHQAAEVIDLFDVYCRSTRERRRLAGFEKFSAETRPSKFADIWSAGGSPALRAIASYVYCGTRSVSAVANEQYSRPRLNIYSNLARRSNVAGGQHGTHAHRELGMLVASQRDHEAMLNCKHPLRFVSFVLMLRASK
jgi:hypothetical protein